MIRALRITDFVRIAELELSLGEGLTVLTGGSGEGKSLVLEALAFGLGETPGGRDAARRLIRGGASRLTVELELDLGWGRLRERLAAAGVPEAALTADRLRLSRSLDGSGRSRLRAGEHTIPLAVLRAAGRVAVARFRQGQAQRLTAPEAQRELLDRCAGLDDDVAAYAQARSALLEQITARDALAATEVRMRQALVVHDDERRALARLEPEPGEYEALVEEQAQLEAFEAQARDAAAALAALDDRDGSPVEVLRGVLARLDRVDGLDEARDALSAGIGLLDESASALEVAVERLGGDPARLARVRERRAAYQALARRLGVAPAGLAARWRDLDGERLEALSAQRDALEAQLTKRWRALDRRAQRLGQARRAAGDELAATVKDALADLGLPQARFTIEVGAEVSARGAFDLELACLPWFQAEHGDPRGPQGVVFAFAADDACPPGPLERASGGELSRIFLALGQRAAAEGDAPLLIVDEVDQNVGARLGGAVGRCLAEHAQGRQVLAVTHLAPVAAQATSHLRVRKQGVGLTCVAVDGAERVEELALMLSGRATDGALSEARALLGPAPKPRRRRPGRRRRARELRV